MGLVCTPPGIAQDVSNRRVLAPLTELEKQSKHVESLLQRIADLEARLASAEVAIPPSESASGLELFRYTSAAAMGGVISAREFLDARQTRKLPSALQLG